MKKMNVGYLRVSTENQTEKYGLDLQKNKIIEKAEKEGDKIDKWYIDGGYSGSTLDRPDIQRLLEDSKNGYIEKVYIYKLDRVSRDTIDTLVILYRTLPEYNVKIVSATEELSLDTPMDKMKIGIDALMGQYEREIISMRTKAGMLERVKSGLWMGGGRIPFGYYYDRNDGILHPKEDEAEKVRTMYRLYNDGYSCQKISDMLGMKGERIVIQILKRKSNIGYIEYKGNIYKGKHEAIIDEETFYKTQRFMEKRSNNSYICNKFLLSGLCFCGKCGARMRYKKWANRHVLECYSRDGYKEYMVKNPNCDNERPDAKDVEKEVSDCFKRFTVNITGRCEKQLSKKELIEKEMKSTVDKLKKLYELYATNESETLLEVIGKSEKRVKELRRELDKEKRKKSLTAPERIEKIKKISDVWDKLDVKEQNKVLKECIDKIVITDGNIDIYFNML